MKNRNSLPTRTGLSSWTGCRRLALGFAFLAAVPWAGNDSWVSCAHGQTAEGRQVRSPSLFPQETQGYACIHHLPAMVEKWNQTEYGKLSQLGGMKKFWEEQRQEIESRLIDAGWQLHLRPQDIYDVTSGEVGIAWLERANPKKPFSVGVAMVVAGREAAASSLLEKIDSELKVKKATTKAVTVAGVTATLYSIPRKANEGLPIETIFARVDDWLFAADETQTLEFMIQSHRSATTKSLVTSEVFQSAFEKLPAAGDQVDFEYFVRPLGFAKVMRAMGKPSGGPKTDLLKVLENQGFDAIAAAGGRVSLKKDNTFDLFHQGYVLAQQPLPQSVQILDFPNEAAIQLPSWAQSNLAGITSVAWNFKEAFWKVEGIVNEFANDKKTFKNVINGIQTDPLGPQVDINKDVMPYLTNEIYSFSDCKQPITPDSKRSLIAIRLKETGKLSKIINRVMSEEGAEPIDFQGVRIWNKSNEPSHDLELDLEEFDIASKSKKKKEAKAEKEAEPTEPWLNQWSVAIYQDFFLFSSHSELIQEVVSHPQKEASLQKLDNEPDYKRAIATIERLAQGRPNCIWQVDRVEKSFEMQYELFRQDKLPQSRSMMASLADRLLRPKQSEKNETQKVKGDLLPAFSEVKGFLMPSGMVVQSESTGWRIQSFVLSKEQPETERDGSSALTADRSETVATSSDAPASAGASKIR